MDIVFLLLAFTSLISFIIGIVKPSAFQEIFKKRATRKNLSLYFLGATMVSFILFGIVTESAQQTPIINDQFVKISEPVIDFEKIREWNPDNDPDAIGLEILISENEATMENIIKLVESITATAKKAVVKIYQNRLAWEEEQTGNYTDIYNEGYLVFYVKNLTDSGLYRDFNEFRWMQEKGNLQNLYGTKTKLL